MRWSFYKVSHLFEEPDLLILLDQLRYRLPVAGFSEIIKRYTTAKPSIKR